MNMLVFEIWDNFNNGIFDYMLSTYSAIDPYFWPLVFIGIIGYIYVAVQSVTVAVVSIIVTFALFGTTTSIFESIPMFSQFLYIIAIVGITCLFVALFIKYSKG